VTHNHHVMSITSVKKKLMADWQLY